MKVSKMPTGKARLTNQGNLSILFLGAGAAFTKTLNDTNILVVKGQDHLMVDCGTKTPLALHKAGIDVTAIQNFFITHSHADHIGGLEEVMMKGRYVARKKPGILITPEYQEILWEKSLAGGARHAEGQGLSFNDFWDVTRPKLLEDAPRETWQAQIGSIDVKMPRTMHTPDSAASWEDSAWSCGLVLDERIMFTSDTRFDPDLLISFDQWLGLDYIFHDCQLFTAGVHASIQELSTLPAELRSKIILMHYGDNWKEFKHHASEYGFHSWAQEGHLYCFDS